MEQQQSQTVEFSRSWQQEETSQETHYHYTGWDLAKEYLMTFLGWIWTAVVFLIATPVFLVMWCINFIRTILGMFIFWIVGKMAFFLIFTGIIALGANLTWLNGETASNLIEWCSIHILGFPLPENSTGFPMFPYIDIEIWLILILSLILATVATIPRSSRY
ncbi:MULTISPECIES: hypothetical protein [Streptococcus]|uniref:hypothetical protein n=1 Tax=Streptococcus TaxID=1301 RepID=UPI000462A4F9|nr:hypothetical protein [Streptococcus suis]MBM0195287.1 hypothetical protein [Streptococcus suis]MBM7316424.1 hypothetical protein [Streptococcus suis]MCL4922692.1 hypothetical protein [Streptococcus suis]MDD7565873.1 hypothetical protein [Streptococcus suis]MDY5054062.1 hypothetical protein [Streptococcus suis]